MFQLNEAVKHNTAKLDETLTKVDAIKIIIIIIIIIIILIIIMLPWLLT